MRSMERLVSPKSEYFIHAPSRLALESFLYPLQCGDFTYLPGYALRRESFDSFLVMYIIEGSLTVTAEGRTRKAQAGSFVYLDCYKPHEYRSQYGCRCLWCHFDGVTARGIYNAVTARSGFVLTVPGEPVLGKLRLICSALRDGPVSEPLLNKHLTDILTAFLLPSVREAPLMSDELAAYISEHFAEDLRVEDLAARAGVSLYHFIRVFKRETGFTPHEYIVNIRMATARYLLKNTSLPVKDICYAVGCSSESVFCSAFKRATGLTPNQYRNFLKRPCGPFQERGDVRETGWEL